MFFKVLNICSFCDCYNLETKILLYKDWLLAASFEWGKGRTLWVFGGQTLRSDISDKAS